MGSLSHILHWLIQQNILFSCDSTAIGFTLAVCFEQTLECLNKTLGHTTLTSLYFSSILYWCFDFQRCKFGTIRSQFSQDTNWIFKPSSVLSLFNSTKQTYEPSKIIWGSLVQFWRWTSLNAFPLELGRKVVMVSNIGFIHCRFFPLQTPLPLTAWQVLSFLGFYFEQSTHCRTMCVDPKVLWSWLIRMIDNPIIQNCWSWLSIVYHDDSIDND